MTRISASSDGDARRAHPHLHQLRLRRRPLQRRVRRFVVPSPAPVVGATEPDVRVIAPNLRLIAMNGDEQPGGCWLSEGLGG